MIRRITLVGFIIMFLLSIVMAYHIKNLYDAQKHFKNESADYRFLKNEYLKSIDLFHFELDSNTLLIDETFKERKLKDLTNAGPILIVRIHEANCQECIINEAVKLLELTKVLDKQKIIILGKFSSMNKLKLFKDKVLRLPFKSYSTDFFDFPENKSIDQQNRPYLFVLNKNIASNIYYPEKSLLDYDLSANYYASILKKIKNELP